MRNLHKIVTIATLACCFFGNAQAQSAGNDAINLMKDKFPLASDIYRAMVEQSVDSAAALETYRSYGLNDEQIQQLIAATKDAASNEQVQQAMASLFTLEELQEMHRFYTGPLSGSIADKLERFEQMIVNIMQQQQPPQIMNTLDALK